MDTIEYWTDKVRDDEAWMQIEAADVMARGNPDGEVVMQAFEGCLILRRLLEGHGLTEACKGSSEAETAAAVALLGRLIGHAEELAAVIEREAERRAEQAAERWESAA